MKPDSAVNLAALAALCGTAGVAGFINARRRNERDRARLREALEELQQDTDDEMVKESFDRDAFCERYFMKKEAGFKTFLMDVGGRAAKRVGDFIGKHFQAGNDLSEWGSKLITDAGAARRKEITNAYFKNTGEGLKKMREAEAAGKATENAGAQAAGNAAENAGAQATGNIQGKEHTFGDPVTANNSATTRYVTATNLSNEGAPFEIHTVAQPQAQAAPHQLAEQASANAPTRYVTATNLSNEGAPFTLHTETPFIGSTVTNNTIPGSASIAERMRSTGQNMLPKTYGLNTAGYTSTTNPQMSSAFWHKVNQSRIGRSSATA